MDIRGRNWRGFRAAVFSLATVVAAVGFLWATLGDFASDTDGQEEVNAPLAAAQAPPSPPESAPRPETSVPVLAPVVQGNVVAADGTPVANASVQAQVAGPGASSATALASASSDAEGAFVLTLTQPGECFLEVSAEGFLPQKQDVSVLQGGLKDVKVVLFPFCSIAGRVLDADGLPVAGLILQTHTKPVDKAEGEVSSEQLQSSQPSDADGAFVVANLYPGTCTLTATSDFEGGQRSHSSLHLAGDGEQKALLELSLKRGEQKTGIVIRLGQQDPEFVIEGHVLTADGMPFGGAKVWSTLGAVSNESAGVAPGPTDETGFFRISFVRDSIQGDRRILAYPVTVQCQATGYEPARVPGVPWGTKDLVITINESRRGAVGGIVLDAATRQPVADARVLAWQVYTDWGDRWRPDFSDMQDNPHVGVRTSGDGRFNIPDVPAGVLTLQVSHPIYGVSLHRVETHVRQDVAAEVTVLLESPGTLTVEASPVGLLRDDQSLDCRLEITPLNVLNLDDQEPWAYNNGSLNKRPIPEVSASMRFANAASRADGKCAWGKRADGHWGGTFPLAPGEYGVAVLGQHIVRTPEGATAQLYVATGKTSVVSGKDSALSFEIGGDSMIAGLLSWTPPEEKKYAVYLTDNERAKSLDEVGDNMAEVMPRLLNAGGCAVRYCALVPGTSGSYQFTAVAPGTYTISAYVTDARTQEATMLGRQELSVSPGFSYTLDLP